MNSDIQAVDIQELVNALLDEINPFPPKYLYRLSDLENGDIEQLTLVWEEIPPWRRTALMEDIFDLGDRDNLLDFEVLALLAVKDEYPETRLSAVHILSEYDSRGLVDIFLSLLVNDPDESVRAASAAGLARFVYAGEVDTLPRSTLRKIDSCLISVVQGNDVDRVRRQALESLGHSERDEIPGMIRTAFNQGDRDWKASALVAMGRSADRGWGVAIIPTLESPEPKLRCEAARAAGRLTLKNSVTQLTEMLDDPDDDAREAAIMALAQIGGPGVRTDIEELLERAEDEFDEEFVQSVLELLDFTEEMNLFPLIDLGDYGEDDDLNYND